MFARFHAVTTTQQHGEGENSRIKRSFGTSLIRPALLLAVSACLLSVRIDQSAAETFPCTDPETCDYRLPPITDPQELIEQADLFAIEVLGYQDRNGNSIPDYRENYLIHVHDCSSISATLDNILEQMGVMGALNCEQASGAGQIRDCTVNHAFNYVPGIGFIDITPISTGIEPYPHIGTPQMIGEEPLLYLEGYPDPDEVVDPAYQGPTGPTPGQEPILLPFLPENIQELVDSLSPVEERLEADAPSSEEVPSTPALPSAPQAPK